MSSGGGKAPSHTSQTVTQNSLDPAMVPYFQNMMSRAEGVSNRPYVTYGGPRIANFTDPQNQAFNAVQGIGGAYQDTMNQATGITAGIAGGPGSQYGAGTFNPTNVTAGQMGQAGTFGQADAQQYMNPYLGTVLDNQLARSNTRFDEQRNSRNSRAARSGVFGGYRQGVEEFGAERDYNQQINDLEGNALHRAYENAQSQYERDRQARFGVERTNIDSTLRADLANQGHGLAAFDSNQRAQQQQEALRQGGIGQLLSASNQLSQQGLANMGAETDRIGLLQDVGLQQQAQQQANLDLAYGDFQGQQNHDLNQLNFLNSILRGVPITTNTSVQQYDNQNPYSQMLGLGINGAALVNSLGGFGGGGGGS